MADTVITKILDIQVRYKDAIDHIAQYRRAVADALAEQKRLRQQLKDGTITQREHDRQMEASRIAVTQNNTAINTLTRQVNAQARAEKEQAGSIAQMRSRLISLTAEYDRLGKAERESARGTELKKKINDVTTELKEAEFATQRFYRNVGNYGQAASSLDTLGQKAGNLKAIFASLAGGLTFGRLMRDVVQAGASFEDQMGKVKAVVNPTTEELATMRAEVLRLGGSTRYTATEAGQAMENLTRNGMSAQEATDALEKVLRLAQANAIELAESADIVTNTLNSYGMEVEEATRVSDVMSMAAASSAMDIKMLMDAMKNSAPMAHQLGVGFEELNATIGALADVGIKGSNAGTMLNQVILGLTSPTAAQAKVFQKYNLDIDENTIKTEGLIATLKKLRDSGIMDSANSMAELSDIFQRRAAPAALTLMSSLEAVDEKMQRLSDSAGKTEQMFGDSFSNFTVSVDSLKSAWESLLIAIFDSGMDSAVGPLDAVTAGIAYVRDHLTELAHIVGNALAAFSLVKLVQHVRESATVSKSSIVANAEAASAKVNTLAQQEASQRANVEALKRQYAQASAEEQGLIANRLTLQKAQYAETEKALHKAKTAEIKAMEQAAAYASGNSWQRGMLTAKVAVEGFVKAANSAMKTFVLTAVISLALELFRQLDELLTQNSEEFRSFKAVVGDFIKTALQKVAQWLGFVIKAFVNLYKNSLMVRGGLMTIKTAFQMLWAVVKSVARNIGNAFGLLKDVISNVGSALYALFHMDFGGIKNAIMGLGTAVKKFFSSTWESVKQGAGEAVDAVKNNAATLRGDKKGTTAAAPTATKSTQKKAADTAVISEDLGGDMGGGADAGGAGGGGSASSGTSSAASKQNREEEERKHQERMQEIIRSGEAALTKLIADNLERQRKETLASYAKQIDDLRKKLQQENDLTAEARTAINNQILALEKERDDKLRQMDEQRIAKLAEENAKELTQRIALAQKGSQQEYDLKREQLTTEYAKRRTDLDKLISEEQQHIEAIEREYLAARQAGASQQQLDAISNRMSVEQQLLEAYNAQRVLMEEELRRKLDEAEDAYQQEKIEKARAQYENDINERMLKQDRDVQEQVELLELQRDRDAQYLQQVQERGQREAQTEEEYAAEVIAAKRKKAESEKAIMDYENEIEQTRYEAASAITGGLIKLTSAVGESNTALAKVSKIIALAQIAIDTGKALASGISSASSMPFPANIAAIATTVATILANIATAISTVKSAKFASGGKVVGAGTGTSDSVPAQLSNGEFVMTAAATRLFEPLLQQMNRIGSGVPMQAMQYTEQSSAAEVTESAMTRAVAAVRPVVSVKEITDTQQRVETIENLDNF